MGGFLKIQEKQNLMAEINQECVEQSPQLKKLLGMFLKQKRKIRSMQKSFAEIECAVIHKCDRYREFIIGECEFYRGEFEPRCVCQKNQ